MPVNLRASVVPSFFSDEKQDVYGVCMGVGCSAFAYNTDIFDRMGINRLPAEGIDWNPGDGGTLLGDRFRHYR